MRGRLPLLTGMIVLVLWLGGLAWFQPMPLVDEAGHQLAVGRIQKGEWHRISYLVMPPGYHALLAVCTLPTGASLWASRLLTFLMSLLTLILVDAAARKRHQGAGLEPLLLALLPFYLPYTSLVYTDAGAILFLAAALAAHMQRRHLLAALAVLAACMIRQSSLVAGLFFAGWIVLDEWGGPPPESALQSGQRRSPSPTRPPDRIWPGVTAHLAVVFGVSLALLFSSSLMSQSVPENRPQPNLGNLYLMSWAGLILWTPLWLPLVPRGLAWLRRRAGAAPRAFALGAAAMTATMVVLFFSFDNWHAWNQDPMFLRNAPLILMAREPLARALGSALLPAGLLAVVAIWHTLPGRNYLYLLAFCTFLFFLPHALVEVRYAIMPFLMADFVAGYDALQQRRLAAWYALLSAGVAILLLSGTFVLW